MDVLDGNAIAGQLVAIFGTEMTMATGTCAGCGARSRVGEFRVYLRAPGTVARCGQCDNVLIVLAEIRGLTCVDMRGLAGALE